MDNQSKASDIFKVELPYTINNIRKNWQKANMNALLNYGTSSSSESDEDNGDIPDEK